MKIEKISEVDFEKVLNNYRKYHGSKNDSWEIRNLLRANKKFSGWIYAQIPTSDIGEIVMPHYKYQGMEIVPEQGAFLENSYEFFKNNEKTIKKENSQFYKRMKYQKQKVLENKIGNFFLSQEPLFIGKSYSGLTKFKGKITHLDGFHRLMAIMDVRNNNLNLCPENIESYIAVYSADSLD